MTNTSRLAVVLGLLFSIISISTSSVAQPPPLPYTHYKIINAEVQGQLVVGVPVTIVAVIQDMGNVESSSGTYEIYINRTPVDYRTIYLSSGDSTTIRYTHYFDSPGTYSIDIVTCSELGSCPDDRASGTIVIKDYSPPPPPPLPPPPPPSQGDWPKIESFYYNSNQELEFRISNYTCPGGLTFRIDFGDGSPTHYRDRANCGRWMVPHKYYGSGPYTAILTVCNSDGSCKTATTTIGGMPPPPPVDRNRPPSVTLSCYPLNLTPNDTLSCEANAYDPNGDPLTYEWFLNGQKLTNISSSSNRVHWDKPQPGSYTLKVVVSDNRGGTNQASVLFTVRDTPQNKPPVIQSIEYDPSNPIEGQLVRFWASVYDENGYIVAYEWDFGTRPYQAEEQAEYAWPNHGTYTVCLTVYDNDGASTRKCRNITVQKARTLLPPRANFTFSPSSPKVGEIVYFKDQSDDPDGRIEMRGWFLNEQFFSSDPNPTTTFQYAGTYTVCLQVVDNDLLNDEKCTTITVLPADKPKQTPVARFTMTAPNGQTAQENQTLNVTVPRGGKVSINFSASNSYDPDGGGIQSYGWWINGTFVSQSSQFTFELGANSPRHLIQLKVTDDEGQTAEVGATVIIMEQQTPEINPTLRVEGSTPSTKQQEQSFNLSGSGYTPNGSVIVFVTKDNKIIGDPFQKKADRNGNISWTWPTSCDTPTGTYELQAIDETTQSPSNTITEIVTSNPACSTPTINPKLWVDNKESSERKQGETFVLTGSGFTPGGEVKLYIAPPEIPNTLPAVGRVINTKAEPNGNARWDWIPQCGNRTGEYKFYAEDVKTGKPSNTVTGKVLPNPAKCGEPSGKVPVIFIPGIKGTELWMGDKRLWPDVACIEYLPWQLDEDDLKLDSGKIVTPGDVIRDLDQYTQWLPGPIHLKKCRDNLGFIKAQGYVDFISALEQVGYVEDQTLFMFPYDWRKDLRSAAKELKNRIDEVLKQTGSQQVDVIAHSMGGLVVRYYLNKIEEPSSRRVRKLILAGTPNQGAPQAFKALVDGDSDGIMRLAFSRTASKRLAQTFPSAYQLLPTLRFFELYHYILIKDRQPINSQGNPKAALVETFSIIVNSSAVADAVRFHSEIGDSIDFSGETLIIAGINQQTPVYFQTCSKSQPIECLLLDPEWGGLEPPPWKQVTNKDGDGTVPLGSVIELRSKGPLSKFCLPADHTGILSAAITEINTFLNAAKYPTRDNCPSYEPNPIGGIDKGDGSLVPPTTKTIEQAIASLVPNDPSDVANPDLVIGDLEMMQALGFYEKQQPVPNTDGQIIDDATMLRLQDLWISRRPVSSSASLTASEIRREWGLLTRQLDSHTLEFIALGFDVRSIKVEIFNLQGQRIFAEEAPSNRLTFRGQDSQGQRLANGIYLYVVTVRNHDGTITRSNVRKLVLQR